MLLVPQPLVVVVETAIEASTLKRGRQGVRGRSRHGSGAAPVGPRLPVTGLHTSESPAATCRSWFLLEVRYVVVVAVLAVRFRATTHLISARESLRPASRKLGRMLLPSSYRWRPLGRVW